MSRLISRLERLWCQTMHDATMWPMHGHYRCGRCLRQYPVPFASVSEGSARERVSAAAAAPARLAGVS